MKPNLTLQTLAVILFCCNTLYSATSSWIGSSSNVWTNPSNWSSSSVPGNNDTVIINAGSTYYPALAASVTGTNAINALHLLGGSLSINGFDFECSSMIISGGSFTANSGNINVTSGFELNGGTLNVGSGTLSITGNFLINGGTLDLNTGDMDVTGDITMISGTVNGGGSTSTITSGNVVDISGGTFNAGNSLDADGSVKISGGSLLGGTASITTPLINLSGGTFTKTSGTFTVSNFIINGGIFTKTSTGTVIVSQDLTINNGTFEAGDGTWIINGDLLMNGGVLNANSALLKVTDSIIIAAGTINAGTSVIDANNTIAILDGTVNANTATLDCADLNIPGGVLNIAGDKMLVNDNITLNGGTLNIALVNMYVPDDFIIRSGTLDLNHFDLTVANDFVYEGGTFTDPGTFFLDHFEVDHVGSFTLNFNIQIVGGGSVLFTNGILRTSPSAMLIFSATASVSGASTRSHVAGPVRKLVSTVNNVSPFVFPIGNGDLYAPIVISSFQNPRAEDYFTAQYDHASAPYNHASKDSTLDHISDVEYWALERSATSGTPTSIAFVGLSYNSANRSGGIFLTGHLKVARWNGSSWLDLGGNVSGNTTSGTVTSALRVDAFSQFTLASTSVLSPLPVALLNFKAVAFDASIKVTWSTTSEVNGGFFLVQKSLDGKNWSDLGVVDVTGYSENINDYSFMDLNPVNGIQFYRLIQTDIDGNSAVSDIAAVNKTNGKVSTGLSLFPNPAAGVVNLSLDESITDGSIVVFNTMGMKVMELNGQSGNLFALDMTEFARDVYTIEIHHENGSSIAKILKN